MKASPNRSVFFMMVYFIIILLIDIYMSLILIHIKLFCYFMLLLYTIDALHINDVAHAPNI